MKKQKDNLTDVVEQLTEADTQDQPQSTGRQQVMNSDGEMITLGYKPKKNVRLVIKGKSLELTESELRKIIKVTIEKELDDFADKLIKKVEEKLAK